MRSPAGLAGPQPKQMLRGAYVSCRLVISIHSRQNNRGRAGCAVDVRDRRPRPSVHYPLPLPTDSLHGGQVQRVEQQRERRAASARGAAGAGRTGRSGPGSGRPARRRPGRPSAPRPSASPTRRRRCSGSARRPTTVCDANPSVSVEERAVVVEAVASRPAGRSRAGSPCRPGPAGSCRARSAGRASGRASGSAPGSATARWRGRRRAPSVTSVPPSATNSFSACEAVVADAAAVLRPDRRSSRCPRRCLRGCWSASRIDVELLAELAGLDVGVVERLRRELVLLEHPARPALVHVGRPRLIERRRAAP